MEWLLPKPKSTSNVKHHKVQHKLYQLPSAPSSIWEQLHTEQKSEEITPPPKNHKKQTVKTLSPSDRQFYIHINHNVNVKGHEKYPKCMVSKWAPHTKKKQKHVTDRQETEEDRGGKCNPPPLGPFFIFTFSESIFSVALNGENAFLHSLDL